MGFVQPRSGRWSRFAASAGAAVVVAALAACGSDVTATNYTDENREAFLTACTIPGEDPTLIRDVCECTYDEIEATVPFADFVAMEERLAFDSLAPLPDEITELMADCFVSIADL
jgi:hypothetical protein